MVSATENWRFKKVFITGASGLVGSWLTRFLIEKKADITVLLRDRTPKSILLSQDINKVNVVYGSVDDLLLVERILGEYEIEVVFHLAAQTIVGIANRNPFSTFESNIRGTYSLLEACRRNPTVKQILVASSDKAYGEQKELPYTEGTPLQGKNPYDCSKSCTDLLSISYAHTFNMPVCITRCGNFYGPGDLNFNRLVPGVMRWGLNGDRPIIRSDGTFIRDYFYVKDGALAYIYLAEKMMKNGKDLYGEAFNFSNEIQISVLEMTKKILKILKREELKPIIENEVKNEIRHQYLSAKKAREMLGWFPKYNMDEALLETVDWYRKYFGDLK